MRKVLVTLGMALVTFSSVLAGENPKLLKEIQRKITLDLSKVSLDKDAENFVLVQFRVVNQEVHIVDIKGSREELNELMLCELENMFIHAETDSQTIYQYRFTFQKEQ